MNRSRKEIASFGIGAVGKDMVYALSASFVMYYYQDLLKISPAFVGTILMIARIFDAFNDPFMGVLVAKTRSKWGRFKPWLISGTVLNAFVLYALFRAPQGMVPAVGGTASGGLMTYFSVVYILWGMTYTMMDIPYWSMIPAVTDTTDAREKLSVVGRTCAGIGNAIITVGTMALVGILGGKVEIPAQGEEAALAAAREAARQAEISGFARLALIVAVLFIVAEVICAHFIRERHQVQMETVGVKDMFRSLMKNDQAIVAVVGVLLINAALYITSNFVIYFFKYDMGGADWKGNYTLFTAVGGASQILSMMVLYPLLRKKQSNTQIFNLSLFMSMAGYALLLLFCFTGLAGSLPLLFIPGVLIFAANGMLTVLTTVFLTSTVDYAELKNGRREESVIFSMQTFVVKAASGLAVFLVGIGLQVIGLNGNTDEEAADAIVQQTSSSLIGLRLLMTIIPVCGLIAAYLYFNKKWILTDQKAGEIAEELMRRRLDKA